MSFERVVLGMDGSEGCRHALDWTVDLAGRLGSRILAVHALPPLAEWVLTLPPFDAESWREIAVRQFREEWCQPLRDADVPHQTIVVDDSPARGLMTAAEDHTAGLIVVGAHGHTGLRERVVGGVSLRLVQQSHVPVVVVPPEKRAPPPGLELGRHEHEWPAGSP